MREGSPALSESGVGESITESWVSLGREVIEDGMPDENSIEG